MLFTLPILKPQIEQLIPHSGDMCLLEKVEHWDIAGIRCIANSHLEQLNPLREKGKLFTHAALEYASQAIALHGELTRGGAHKKPNIGYLVSVSNIQLATMYLDEQQKPLLILAKHRITSGKSSAYDVDIRYVGGGLIMQGRLTVIVSHDII